MAESGTLYLLILLLLRSQQDIEATNCRRSVQGTEYTGGEKKTESKWICQRWSDQTPHTHPYSDEAYFPGGIPQNPRCRNPHDPNTNSRITARDRPWCYVDSLDPEAPEWEYCNIGFCCKNASVRNVVSPADVNGVYILFENHTCNGKASYVKDPYVFSYVSAPQPAWVLGNDLTSCPDEGEVNITSEDIWSVPATSAVIGQCVDLNTAALNSYYVPSHIKSNLRYLYDGHNYTCININKQDLKGYKSLTLFNNLKFNFHYFEVSFNGYNMSCKADSNNCDDISTTVIMGDRFFGYRNHHFPTNSAICKFVDFKHEMNGYTVCKYNCECPIYFNGCLSVGIVIGLSSFRDGESMQLCETPHL